MGTVRVVVVRRRGRPRLGNIRIECIVPQEVFEQLLRAEKETGTYRTRIAANVICEWAKAQPNGDAPPLNTHT